MHTPFLPWHFLGSLHVVTPRTPHISTAAMFPKLGYDGVKQFVCIQPFPLLPLTMEAHIFNAESSVMKSKVSSPGLCHQQAVGNAVAEVNGEKENISLVCHLLIEVRYGAVKT